MALSAQAAASLTSGVVASFFQKAIQNIDAQFGIGFARNNPDLVAALVSASSITYNTVAMTNGIIKEEEKK